MTETDIKEQQKFVGTQVELKICANPAYLPAVRAIVRKVNQVVGLQDEDDLITLAVEEALANVIRHSYGGACDKPIVVKFNKISDGSGNKTALEILIRDFGKQVEPGSIKGRDLDELRAGGLGVHLIQSAMDEIEYSCVDDAGMQLRMVKFIT